MLVAFLLASIIVAFTAGVVALAMPCCFTVLLPAYLAKSFDTVTGRLGMTAIFGAGIATILLPIAIGVTELTTILTTNHALLFGGGGFCMVVLGLLTFWGVPILPMRAWGGVDLGRRDVPSVYSLGVFSGVASTCCAPVLAGVLVLSAFSGGIVSSVFVGLAYVAGMVFPLLVVATVWDRRAVRLPSLLRGRMVRLRLFRWQVDLHSSKLVAGSLFVIMGIVTVGLGLLDRMLLLPGSSTFGIYEGPLERGILAAFDTPWVVAGLLALLALGSALASVARIRRRRSRHGRPEPHEAIDEDESAEALVDGGESVPTD